MTELFIVASFFAGAYCGWHLATEILGQTQSDDVEPSNHKGDS